jgi:hypothetical protein
LEYIELQGVLWQITANLYAALKALRSESAPREMRIDAFCISQKDNYEKSLQIFIMGEIYASATQTIAWLSLSNHRPRISFH